jgi:HK97 family phage major capsid protein/HK97 family phage prohead protease
MNRAYSILNVKEVDSDRRIVRGIATTPTPDRIGDIIEPLGVEFKNPMPLLWQHKHDKPVGQVNFKKPTKDGIDFEAHITKSDGVQSTTLKDRLDEAWESVKLGLVRAVSIGFRPKEYSFMKETDGIHFQETEVMELSLVTIPANMEAVISEIKSADKNVLSVIKSLDAPSLAASGLEMKDSDRPTPPGVTGHPKKILPKAKTMKTIKERIAAFEASRAAKVARMEELMTKAGDELSTLEQAESEEYDSAELEVKEIDKHLVRLRTLEKANREQAQTVEAEVENKSAPERVRVSMVKADLPKGTAFTRYCMALAASKGNRWEALNIAKQWKDQTPEVSLVLEHDIPTIMRATVGAGTTTDATFAAPLVTFNVMASEFIALLRPATIIGRIPGLRRVPFNIQMPRSTAGTSVGWVGENAPKPVTNMAFDTVTLRWAKAAGIVVLTDELVRFSNPSAEAVVRADIVAAMAQFLDRQFVDPAVAEITNVSPASITNGVTPVTPSGTTAAAFRADIKTLFASFLTANLTTSGGVWIMTQQQALSLAIMQNALGQAVFPTMNDQTGGTLLGYPVVASENIPSTTGSPTEGFPLIFALAPEIMLADDGQVVIDASNQASVQMESAASLDSPPTASSVMVSLWQMNMTGLRAERWINWKKRRATAVGYIQSAKYSE